MNIENELRIIKACNKHLITQLVEVQAELQSVRELNILVLKALNVGFPEGASAGDYALKIREVYKNILEGQLAEFQKLL